MCFGKYLFNGSGKVPLSEEQLAAINAEMRTHTGDQMLYYQSVYGAAAVPMGHALATKKSGYAEVVDPNLLALSPLRHCVVHYRVGDFVEYASQFSEGDDGFSIVSPKSVAVAMASFYPSPLTVEILNSGASHFEDTLMSNHSQSREDIEKAKSWRALQKLKDAISEALPDARVSMSFNGTPDEDWFKLSKAPLAVISMGSFGLSAVMAGMNNQVRSPATWHLLDVSGQGESTQIRSGWITYEYELEDWNTM